MTCVCGSEWWVEEKALRLAGGPSEEPQRQSVAREVRYRLKCAECGLQFGEKPKTKGAIKNGRQKQERKARA